MRGSAAKVSNPDNLFIRSRLVDLKRLLRLSELNIVQPIGIDETADMRERSLDRGPQRFGSGYGKPAQRKGPVMLFNVIPV